MTWADIRQQFRVESYVEDNNSGSFKNDFRQCTWPRKRSSSTACLFVKESKLWKHYIVLHTTHDGWKGLKGVGKGSTARSYSHNKREERNVFILASNPVAIFTALPLWYFVRRPALNLKKQKYRQHDTLISCETFSWSCSWTHFRWITDN